MCEWRQGMPLSCCPRSLSWNESLDQSSYSYLSSHFFCKSLSQCTSVDNSFSVNMVNYWLLPAPAGFLSTISIHTYKSKRWMLMIYNIIYRARTYKIIDQYGSILVYWGTLHLICPDTGAKRLYEIWTGIFVSHTAHTAILFNYAIRLNRFRHFRYGVVIEQILLNPEPDFNSQILPQTV